MALDALAGLSNDLITRSWMASNTTKPFHKEEEGNTVFFGFKSSFLEKDLFDPENESPFGETKMNREQFPCMRSIGNDVDATVNEAFLKNLQLLVSTSFPHSVSITNSFDLLWGHQLETYNSFMSETFRLKRLSTA